MEVENFDEDKTVRGERLFRSTNKNVCQQIFANSYVPEYAPKDLPWYECDGLMTYIDQLKYKELISDSDATVKNTKIITFEMIHAQCRGTPRTHSDQFYQTIREMNVAKMSQKDRKKKQSRSV